MRRVTLSFDNGPHPSVTPAVLDILDRHAVKSSFFVVGKNLDASPAARAAARRAKDAGHLIGNHSYTHSIPLGELPDETACTEIHRTAASLGDLAGQEKLFRPFGGGGRLGTHLLNAAAADLLVAERYTCVTWNAIPRDWNDPDGWPERARAACRDMDWPLMVLHDIEGACLDHLDAFLDWLHDNDIEISQDFPDDCLPIRDGRANATPWLPNNIRR